MCDYEFIKKCRNYNIKKSKGLKYETVVKRSLNKLKENNENRRRLENSLWGLMSRFNIKCYVDTNAKFRVASPYDKSYSYYKGHHSNEVKRKLDKIEEEEKFKMSVHYLKTKLPDALILNIGSFL